MITLYITSTQLKLLTANELTSLGRQGELRFPQQYCNFMQTYGVGTYGGAIYINAPDFDILKDFSECDFWQHENAPIMQEQIKDCVVIGNSIDGDFIAIHSNINGYILLPRQSDIITFIPYSDEEFVESVNKIGFCLYNEKLEGYFEPVGCNHVFLRSVNKGLYDIADRFKSLFQNDYLIENDYICEVFFLRLGGYVRFNLAYGFEVAIFYSHYGLDFFQEIKKFMNENGCQ